MIIRHLLDNDQYNFTMQQAILKLGFAAVPVKYKFKCRTEGIDFSGYKQKIFENFKALSELTLTKDEYEFMRSLRYFSKEYLDFLKYFRFDNSLISICDKHDDDLSFYIEGPWFQTILFEVPMLSIISEVYMEGKGDQKVAVDNISRSLTSLPRGLKFSDFGTRRRKSFDWHESSIIACNTLAPLHFNGTSNMYFAMKHNLTSIGTMSHGWLQAHQQLGYRVADSQKMAFENWIKVYRGNLGIALSDVINTDAFLKDFDDPLFYKLFDGVREDSEPDPIAFGHRIIDFYNKRKIDPKSKTIVFSNSLDFVKMGEIYLALSPYINTVFGIGTKLTNNWDVPALNIVIKMIECNGQPVAKISNEPGKRMCESPEFEAYLKSSYGVCQ